MRAVQALAMVAFVSGMSGELWAQNRGDAARPVTLDEIRRGERHPLAPNHRLDTITLGRLVPRTDRRPLYVVTIKRISITEGRGTETNWPGAIMYGDETSTIEKLKRREFTVSPGSPTAKTRQEFEPTVVTLAEGSRVEIRLLDSGDERITVDVTYEELSIDEGETIGVRDKMVATPQQTMRRVRTFRTAKLGSTIAIPLDAASAREARQLLQLQVTRK